MRQGEAVPASPKRRARRDAHARGLLASIVESSDDAIVAKTLDGIVTTWNGAAERLFGYSADEMIGRTLEPIFPPGLFGEEAGILARIARGERIEHYETTRVRKDGTRIDVSVSISPVRDENGRIVAAAKIARDVTEQNAVRARLDAMQAQLLHVSRLNDMAQMATGLAHELNQPLSAVSNYISGAQKLIAKGNLERAAEGCERAAAQVARAGEVIRRLRDFVGKAPGKIAPVDLAELIDDSEALAFIGVGPGSISTEVRIAPDARMALIDKIQIQQVIVNLARNAAEAMARQPVRRLVISAQRDQSGMIEVAVADTGCGLPAEVKARLFQPFTTTKQSGLGVGLSLCRSIVEAHGGRIKAEDNPGGGAVFRFTLPVA
jgi:two-component system sensor kinase FixL